MFLGNYFFSMTLDAWVAQDAADRLSRTRSHANLTSMNLIEMIKIFSFHYSETNPIMRPGFNRFRSRPYLLNE